MPVEMLFLNCSLPLIIMSIHPNATGSEATGRLPFNSKDAYIVLFAGPDGRQFSVSQGPFLHTIVAAGKLEAHELREAILAGRGQTKASIIKLPHDISSDEFESYLRFIDPPGLATDPHNLTQADWISILKLSTRWYCVEHREKALSRINSNLFNTAELVRLGRECYVHPWVRHGLHALAGSSDYISPSQTDKITAKTALDIYRIRERRSQDHTIPFGDQEYEATFPKKYTGFEGDVDHVFREELQSLLDSSAMFTPYSYSLDLRRQSPGLKRKHSELEYEGVTWFVGPARRQRKKLVRHAAEVTDKFVSSFLPLVYYAREFVCDAL